MIRRTPRVALALRLTFCSPLLLAVVVARTGAAQQPTDSKQRSAAVTVTLTVDSLGGVSLRERYANVGDSVTRSPRLRALTRQCAEISAAQWSDQTGVHALVPSATGIWMEFGGRSPSGVTALADSFGIDYRVQARGRTIDVPLILPAHTIARSEGAREGAVTVIVEGLGSRGEVRFPQLVHDATNNRWSGRFVAIPSFVRLSLDAVPNASCDAAPARGDDGGLVWRFWLLVGILVAWVPLYLWWARRATSADA